MVSSGYGIGSGRVRIERDAAGQWSATPLWRSNRMKAKFTNLILRGGFIYGLDDGVMACLDAKTGALAWKDGRYGHGQELLVGDILLVMAENGEVVLVDPAPDRLRELARSAALAGKTWNPPAVAGEYLLVRNDKEAACFRLPLRR
jgi:outer membrane protein assembly factor BamB